MVHYMVMFYYNDKWQKMEQEHRGIRQETDPNRSEYLVEIYRGEAGRPKQGKTGLRLYATEAVQNGVDILPNAHVKTIRMFTDAEWVNNHANARIEKWERLCNELLDLLRDGYFFVTMAPGTRAIKLAKPLSAGESASEDGRPSFADMVSPAVLHRRVLPNNSGGISRGSRAVPPAAIADDERDAAEALAVLQYGRSSSLTDAPARIVDTEDSDDLARRPRDSDDGSASGSAPAPRRQRVGDGGSAAADRSPQTRELLQKLDLVVNRIIANGCVNSLSEYAVRFICNHQGQDVTNWWVNGAIDLSPETVITRFPKFVLEVRAQKLAIYSTLAMPDGIGLDMHTVTVEYPLWSTQADCQEFCRLLFSMLDTGWFVHSGSPSGVRVAKYVDLNHSSRRLNETLRRVHEALDTI